MDQPLDKRQRIEREEEVIPEDHLEDETGAEEQDSSPAGVEPGAQVDEHRRAQLLR